MTREKSYILHCLTLFLLLMAGIQDMWAGVRFQSIERLSDNGNGTYTSSHNAGNKYALAIADLSNLAGITTKEVVTVEFDCYIPSGSRWNIGFGDKAQRVDVSGNYTAGNPAPKTNYNATEGLMFSFGTSDGNTFTVRGSGNYDDAFNKNLHVSVTFNRSSHQYSYTLMSGSTTIASGSNIDTSVSELTLIEAYSWQSYSTVTLGEVKALDGLYFQKPSDVMYIEDLTYSPLVNETGQSVTFSGNYSGFLRELNGQPTYPLHPIKTTGATPDNSSEGTPLTLTATTTGGLTLTSTMDLHIKTRRIIDPNTLVSGSTFNAGNATGLLDEADNKEYVMVGGLKLWFGANKEYNGKKERQLVCNTNGYYGVICIDANGWSFGNIIDWNNDSEYWGTFYRLEVPATLHDLHLSFYLEPGSEAGLYDKNGTRVVALPAARSGLTIHKVPKSQLTANTVYYLYCPQKALVLNALTYDDYQAGINYSGTLQGVMFTGETHAAPTVTVIDADGNDVTSHYTMAFTSSDGSVATVNSTTGVVTAVAEGETTISCTLTGSDGHPNMTATTKVYVTDGDWDIQNYANYTSLDNNLSDSQWSLRGSGHVRNKLITNSEFEFIYNKTGGLYTITNGLQLKGNTRFVSNGFSDNSCNASITLFSIGDNAALRIPARRGMVVTITSFASDDETQLRIEGVENIDGSAANVLTANQAEATARYICNTDDGYITLYNENTRLAVSIQRIVVSREIILADGDDGTTVYVNREGSYQNHILNAEGSGSTFAFSWVSGSHSFATDATDFATTGHISAFTGYGSATIKVTATGGLLDGLSKDYTIKVIKMSIVHSGPNALLTKLGVNGTISDDTSLGTGYWNYKDDLKRNVRIYSVDDTHYNENPPALNQEVTFTVESVSKPHTTATITKSGGNYQFAANGLGDVVIKATLGKVEKTFTYHIQGVDFVTTHAVIDADRDSYDLEISKTIGQINSISSYTIYEVNGNLNNSPTLSLEGNTIHISNITAKDGWTDSDPEIPSSKGGTYIVNAIVNYTPPGGAATNMILATYLTVAYKQHVWNFQGGQDGLNPYGISGSLYPYEDNEGTSYTARPLPKDADDYNVARSLLWEYQKKFRSPDSNAGYVYVYRFPIDCTNPYIINETAGLQIYSEGNFGVTSAAEYTDNGFRRDGKADGGDYWYYNEYKYSKEDKKRELVFKNGCRIVIPHLKAGQQIDCYWHRHSDDQGERLRMKNLCDASGTEITDIYKIAYTKKTHSVAAEEENGQTVAGCYSFIVKDTGEEWVDVEITSVDNNWTRLHEIVLHEPRGIVSESQSTYETAMTDLNPGKYLRVADGMPHRISLDEGWTEVNIHNGGLPSYTVTKDATLTDATVEWENGHPVLNYQNGWGKFYVTLSNTTQDGKYISTWKNYTITIGKQPGQSYPYTWDFTKYRTTTKEDIAYRDFSEENTLIEIREDKNKTIRRATQTWNFAANNCQAQTTGYGGSSYESYFVNNAQLVSTALNGQIPETDGLSFNLDVGNGTLTSLNLNMSSTIAGSTRTAYNGQTWSETGCLSIGAGGQINLPKPGASFNDFYLYVLCSSEPSINATVLEKLTVDVSDAGTKKQYCYHFLQDADATLTFNEASEVYVIAVTNRFKQLTHIGTNGWATESRNTTTDLALTSLLTTNPVKAYAIIETPANPIYSEDKTTTHVSLVDERYVVPANVGVVLRQTDDVPTGDNYSVPLFTPAVTTAADPSEDFEHNLVRPNVSTTLFTTETVDFNGTTETDGTHYSRFILTNRFATWKKAGDEAVTSPTAFTTGNRAMFYRMHIYDNSFDGKTVAELNTLGANKAYLLLKTDKIAPALWTTGASARGYVGIIGESDITLFEEETEHSAEQPLYNLQGQMVSSEQLPRGVYIRNGKKHVVK